MVALPLRNGRCPSNRPHRSNATAARLPDRRGGLPGRAQCVAAAAGSERTVQLHAQEALLEQYEAFAEYRQCHGGGGLAGTAGPAWNPPVPLLRAHLNQLPIVFDTHFARVGRTDPILLPNQGFPSEFLGLLFSLVFAEAVHNNIVHCEEFICGEVRYPCRYLSASGAVIPTDPIIGLIQDIASFV